jgi:hypothetical protein
VKLYLLFWLVLRQMVLSPPWARVRVVLKDRDPHAVLTVAAVNPEIDIVGDPFVLILVGAV